MRAAELIQVELARVSNLVCHGTAGSLWFGCVAAALTVATGAPAPNIGAYRDWLGIGVTLLSTIIIVGLFEEVRWRDFALPRLQRRFDALWAALVLGVIWAPWHLQADL